MKLSPGFKERLRKDVLRDALGDRSFLGADPVFRLPVLRTIIWSLVNKEVLGAAAHPGLDTSLLAERARFPQGRFVAIEGSVDVVVMVNNMPVHGSKGS